MSVVTVSREYGTDGRSFGKLLARELDFTYADKMIARELAEKMNMNEEYVRHFLDTGIPVGMSSSKGGSFSYDPAETQKNVNLQIESQKLLRELARDKDIVIVGRASDIILQEYDPFKIFIYGENAAKIANVQNRKSGDSKLSVKDIQREMTMVDTERYQHHALFSQNRWGEKTGYDLCINMTNVDIKKCAPAVATYIKIALGIA